MMFASMDEGPSWLPSWVYELGTPAWVCDSHGKVTFLNDRARQLFLDRYTDDRMVAAYESLYASLS